MLITKKDIKTAIETENINLLKTISEEVQNLYKQSNEEPLPVELFKVIKYYSKIVNEWAKKIFNDNSTCEIINDNIEETVPWQVGTIKAYCCLLLENGSQ